MGACRYPGLFLVYCTVAIWGEVSLEAQTQEVPLSEYSIYWCRAVKPCFDRAAEPTEQEWPLLLEERSLDTGEVKARRYARVADSFGLDCLVYWRNVDEVRTWMRGVCRERLDSEIPPELRREPWPRNGLGYFGRSLEGSGQLWAVARGRTSDKCLYSADFCLVKESGQGILSRWRACNSSPNHDFGGFVSGGHILAYVLDRQSAEGDRVAVLSSNGTWNFMSAESIVSLAASPNGHEVLSITRARDALAAELCDIRLDNPRWKTTLDVGFLGKPFSVRVYWSLDGRIAAVDLEGQPGSTSRMIVMNIADGQALKSHETPTSFPLSSGAVVIFSKGSMQRASQLIGVELQKLGS